MVKKRLLLLIVGVNLNLVASSPKLDTRDPLGLRTLELANQTFMVGSVAVPLLQPIGAVKHAKVAPWPQPKKDESAGGESGYSSDRESSDDELVRSMPIRPVINHHELADSIDLTRARLERARFLAALPALSVGKTNSVENAGAGTHQEPSEEL